MRDIHRFTVGDNPGLYPPNVDDSGRKVRKLVIRRCQILRKGGEMRSYSCPEMQKVPWFLVGFCNRRSPPVSILRTARTVIPVSGLCAGISLRGREQY